MIHHRLLFSLLALTSMLLCSFGCATSRPVLSPEAKSETGTLGIVSAKYSPEIYISAPIKRTATNVGMGAAAGALYPLVDFSAAGPFGFIVGVIMAPAGAIIGGIGVAATAESAEIVEEAEVELWNSFEGFSAQDAVSNNLFATAKGRTGRSFIKISNLGPAVPDEKPDYRGLVGDGIETIIEVSVIRYGLGKYGTDGPFDLLAASFIISIEARLRVIKTGDGAVIYTNTLNYMGKKNSEIAFVDWAADNASRFKEERGLSFRILSDKIVEKLFNLSPRTVPQLYQDAPSQQGLPRRFRFL